MSRESAPIDSAQQNDDGFLPAYFPITYLFGLFNFLKNQPDFIKVITYKDLAWIESEDHGSFPKEHQSWTQKMHQGELDPTKAYLLIQYDVDSMPERAMRLLSSESHQGVPANVMIFNKRVNRKRLKNLGELAYTDYPLDDDLLLRLQGDGFLIGYHSNANERGGFQVDGARTAMNEDLTALHDRFGIEFYTAHGGVAGPDGRNNAHLPFADEWAGKVRWVHNGSSPTFDGVFSDGGHNNVKRDPANRDIRDFVASFKRGKRYRILLHPQYYDSDFVRSQAYGGTRWYADMIDHAQADPTFDPWANFKL